MTTKRSRVICCFLILILLTSCWDAVNIEERGFITGMAIDLAEEGNSNGNYQLTLTNQVAVPPGLGTPSQGGSDGSKGFMNITASGTSLYDIAQKLANQTNKMPFFEHLKVVIVSEEVAAIPDLFANVMDVFIRNRDTRRGIKVIIAKGKAKDLLQVQPENDQLPARYIDKILENSLSKTGEVKPVRVGDIHEYLLHENSFVISEVSADETKIHFEGGSVFKGKENKIIGSLNLEEMLGYELITGQEVQGPIVFQYKDELTVYSIREASSKVKINVTDPEKVNIHVKIKLEGEIQETFGTVLIQDQGVIEALEKGISKKVEEIANQAIHKAQKELEADIFNFAENLHKHHYDIWKKVNHNWDNGENYFSKSKVKVTVISEVRSDGVVDQSKNKNMVE